MKRMGSGVAMLLLLLVGKAQNLELRQGKDFKQPGKINPALAGVQEDFLRVLSDAEIGSSYQLMLDGKLPFKLGNYMVGWERLYTDNVQDNMFTITYGRTVKKKERKSDFQWRYGGTFEMHTKNLLKYGFDSTSLYNFQDINGEIKNVPQLADLEDAINYFNLDLGAGFTYKGLFVAGGIGNFMGQDLSLVKTEERKTPFTTNLTVGGFINATDKMTVFPSLMMLYNSEQSYLKTSVDLATDKLTFSASFMREADAIARQELSGSFAYRFKKNHLVGIKYTHPIDDASAGLVNSLPRFNLYLNSTLLKSPKMFMGALGKQMRKFY